MVWYSLSPPVDILRSGSHRPHIGPEPERFGAAQPPLKVDPDVAGKCRVRRKLPANWQASGDLTEQQQGAKPRRTGLSHCPGSLPLCSFSFQVTGLQRSRTARPDASTGREATNMAKTSGVAPRLAKALAIVLGTEEIPIRLRAWDGSEAGPADAPVIEFRSRRALRRMLWSPGQLGLSRAYVAGEIEAHGDIFAAFTALSSAGKFAEPGPFRKPTARERDAAHHRCRPRRSGSESPRRLPRRRRWKSTDGGTRRSATLRRSPTITTSATTSTARPRPNDGVLLRGLRP